MKNKRKDYKNYSLVDCDEVPDGVIIPDDQWAVQIEDVYLIIDRVTFPENESNDQKDDSTVQIDYTIIEGDPDTIENISEIIGSVVNDMLIEAMELDDMKENQNGDTIVLSHKTGESQ